MYLIIRLSRSASSAATSWDSVRSSDFRVSNSGWSIPVNEGKVEVIGTIKDYSVYLIHMKIIDDLILLSMQSLNFKCCLSLIDSAVLYAGLPYMTCLHYSDLILFCRDNTYRLIFLTFL